MSIAYLNENLDLKFLKKTEPPQEYDAVVVGSGPNGLAAAIRLSLEGLSVKLIEAKPTVGGGMRSAELMESGIYHDICSAIHPMAIASPFFKKLPLEQYGLKWIHPTYPAAHPLENGSAVLYNQLSETAFHLGRDEKKYKSIVEPLTDEWEQLSLDLLSPLHIPNNPLKMARFGLSGLQSATHFQKNFKTEEAKALFAGMAAHSILSLDSLATTAIALIFFATAHTGGWPLPEGGSQKIADALAGYFKTLGGEIETSNEIKKYEDLPKAKVVLFDLTPQQVSQIMGDHLPPSYQKRLSKFRYGGGAFKVDYILNEPVPWKDHICKKAGTVHVGGTFGEIADSEKMVSEGKHPENPFVLVAQQSLFDFTRTNSEKQTLWAYCHVPNGSKKDMTLAIDQQIERFAPGFRDIIISKRTMNTSDFHEYNANYIGGDINGGAQDIRQLFSRPVSLVNPYATPMKGIYLCSSSTPPGGGIHGMCGYHAANLALRREFGIKSSNSKFRN